MTTSKTSEWMTAAHRAFLTSDAKAQFDFFEASLRPDAGFYVLDVSGHPLPSDVQELHTTTRLVHSYALGKLAGRGGCDAIIDQGMAYLMSHHKDQAHGGYVWAVRQQTAHDDRKLAYGHVFVLLAASSALAVGHPDAENLLADIDHTLDQHFWEEDFGLFCDEFNADWSPFSSYRGMNANMHGAEALLAAYEVTGQEKFLHRAGRILEFFAARMAPAESWRLPEHYTDAWSPDRDYSGDPMFRPAGTTPGHSFEVARLYLQYNALAADPNSDRVHTARKLAYQALTDSWDAQHGGCYYTLDYQGRPDVTDRYWWPVTEAIGVLAALLKTDPQPEDVTWYNRLWDFAKTHFVDGEYGGWLPEIDASGSAVARQFNGKPDIYHSIQAVLFPMLPGVADVYGGLKNLAKEPGH